MELPIPHFFLSENAKELKEREKLLGSILAQMGPQDAVQVQAWGTLASFPHEGLGTRHGVPMYMYIHVYVYVHVHVHVYCALSSV